MTGDGGRQVPTPTMNPQAQSHEALKAMTDAAQPAGAQAVADGWSELAAGFDEAVGLFDRAMLASETGWTGAAADAMRAHLARVARWSKAMGAHYQAAGAAIGTQAAAAESAKSAMPPPVPYDPAQMIREARESGNIAQMAMLPFRLYAQKQKHDAAHDEAARIVSERDQTFGRAASEIPPFEPPPRLSAEGGGDSTASEPAIAPGGGLVVPDARRVDDPPARDVSAGKPESSTPADRPNGATPTDSASGATSPSGTTAPSGASPGATTPSGAAPGVTAPSGAAPPVPVQGFGPGSAAAGFAGFGPSAGFGPGGSPASGLAAAFPRGPAGMAMSGGTAPTEADAERKRPEYLVESDTDGMFSSDELTSPPVIGEA